MASLQTTGMGFPLGDERGFMALVSGQTGNIEAVRDGRLSMPLRELLDLNFTAASEPTTLRYLRADLPVGAELLGRLDVLELSAPTASKTIEVSQGKSLGGAIRIKFSDVSSPFQWVIDSSAEPKTTGRWLLNVDPSTPFTIDCMAFRAETGEPLVEVLRKPLTFLIDCPSHVILAIQARRLLEDTCILTDAWQMAAVLSSLFHASTRYLPVLPVRSVPRFFAKRQLTSVRQCLADQQPTRIIFADVPEEIEREILWGIPNLGAVERYRSLQDVYRLLPTGDPVVCSPKEMPTGLLTAKRMGRGLVLEEGHELSLCPETMSGSLDVVLVEGSCLASVVAVNYAYFRGAELIDVGEMEPSRLAWFDQKCAEIDDRCHSIR